MAAPSPLQQQIYDFRYAKLMQACYNRDKVTVEAMLGECFKFTFSNGANALEYACLGGAKEIVKLLFSRLGQAIYQKSQYGYTPLHAACQNGHVAVAELLLDTIPEAYQVSRIGESPLHSACRFGHANVAAFLLRKIGAHIYQPNLYGETPLHLACCAGFIELVNLLIREIGVEIVERTDKFRRKPIDAARAWNRDDVVKALSSYNNPVIDNQPKKKRSRKGKARSLARELAAGENKFQSFVISFQRIDNTLPITPSKSVPPGSFYQPPTKRLKAINVP